MKFRIAVSEEKQKEVEMFLSEHGIEAGEEADYVITEASRYASFLSVRDDRREHLRLSADEVVCIEAFGKDIEIHTMQGVFFAQDRMYRLEALLDPQEFLRVSKSVIVSRKHVKKIRPSLSMKYVLTLSNGELVDVTRSYYNDFRSFFGI